MCYFYRFFKDFVFILLFIFYKSGYAEVKFICFEHDVPAGAVEVNANIVAFVDCPRLSDVDFSGLADNKKYYSGLWFSGPRSSDYYRDSEDGLVIKKGGKVAAVKNNSLPGYFPLLSGAHSFYIEVQASLSSNDPDNFPAIWLMPIEHNFRMEDVYQPDPRNFERWFELDIDEGGFGPGGHNTAISWSGVWPNYKKIQNPNPSSRIPLDRTIPHVFGVSYDPETLSVVWWLDGNKVLTAKYPYVPDIAKRQSFYPIISAQSHKNISDYHMVFHGIRAYVGSDK